MVWSESTEENRKTLKPRVNKVRVDWSLNRLRLVDEASKLLLCSDFLIDSRTQEFLQMFFQSFILLIESYFISYYRFEIPWLIREANFLLLLLNYDSPHHLSNGNAPCHHQLLNIFYIFCATFILGLSSIHHEFLLGLGLLTFSLFAHLFSNIISFSYNCSKKISKYKSR